jgi:subtilase family serine protease
MRTTMMALSLLVAGLLLPAHAQDRGRGAVYVPDSSVEDPADRGQRAHTNHRMLVSPGLGLDKASGGGMTSAQIQAFYSLPSSGGVGIIAIIDAYHYDTALRDFNAFCDHFTLPKETSSDPTASTNKVFQVMYQGSKKPRSNTGWAQEAALDIEWAHALAPTAKIVLIEANSASFGDLLACVDKAVVQVKASQVSMSWGGSEFSTEASFDSHFNVKGPLFFAASGDTGGATGYPAASPYVVAVGGTSVQTDATGYIVTSESGWDDPKSTNGSGGGTSAYEAKPDWQGGVENTGGKRSIPDIAADADPNTGVAVYAPMGGGYSQWVIFGGTSVATPCMAAIANLNGGTYPSITESNTTTLLRAIYKDRGTAAFRDITTGGSGKYNCLTGWDFVTGVGSPQGTGF